MTKVIAEEVNPFHKLLLPSQFALIYLNATFITFKQGVAPKDFLMF